LTKVNVRELSQAAAGFIDLIALVFGVAAGAARALRCFLGGRNGASLGPIS
jgi:hypothetical protein